MKTKIYREQRIEIVGRAAKEIKIGDNYISSASSISLNEVADLE
jgi:hypothetical protein